MLETLKKNVGNDSTSSHNFLCLSLKVVVLDGDVFARPKLLRKTRLLPRRGIRSLVHR